MNMYESKAHLSLCLVTGYLAMISHTSYTSAFIHCCMMNHSAQELCFSLSVGRNRGSICEMFAVLSQGKWAGSTSVLSWLKSILLKYCLFWAQAQNSNVSDGLGKQINRLILTVVLCLFIWAICACCSCQTSSTRFISLSVHVGLQSKVLSFITKA